MRILKLKALFKALNQSAVTLRCVTVGKGYSEFDTWRGKEGRREGQRGRRKGIWVHGERQQAVRGSHFGVQIDREIKRDGGRGEPDLQDISIHESMPESTVEGDPCVGAHVQRHAEGDDGGVGEDEGAEGEGMGTYRREKQGLNTRMHHRAACGHAVGGGSCGGKQ